MYANEAFHRVNVWVHVCLCTYLGVTVSKRVNQSLSVPSKPRIGWRVANADESDIGDNSTRRHTNTLPCSPHNCMRNLVACKRNVMRNVYRQGENANQKKQRGINVVQGHMQHEKWQCQGILKHHPHHIYQPLPSLFPCSSQDCCILFLFVSNRMIFLFLSFWWACYPICWNICRELSQRDSAAVRWGGIGAHSVLIWNPIHK